MLLFNTASTHSNKIGNKNLILSKDCIVKLSVTARGILTEVKENSTLKARKLIDYLPKKRIALTIR